MRPARRLAAAFLLLAPIAVAQNPPNRPTEVTGLKLSDQKENEIRIELSTTGSVPSAEVVATYRDSLVLDLPGAVYRALPRRLQVNHAGIRAVRLWMQSENPPLTRVVVEIDRTEQYLVSSDGKSVVLRVGPVLEGASPANTPSTAEVYGSRKANPAARGTASSSVAGAVSAIFRNGPGKATVYKGPKIREPGQSVTASARRNDGLAQAAKSDSPSVSSPDSALPAGQESSAANAQPLDATPNPALESSQNPPTTASATTIAPAGLPVADSPVVAASKEAKSGVVVLNRFPGAARDESSPEHLSAAPARDINSVTSALPPNSPSQAEPAASKSDAASVPSASSANSVTGTLPPNNPAQTEPAAPKSDAVAVAPNAPEPATLASPSNSPAATPSAGTSAEPESPTPISTATPEETVSEANSAPAPRPTTASAGGRSNSVPDSRALLALANPGMRTEFYVKFVEQESAYLDGGRSSGLTEGLKLVVKKPTPEAGAKGNPSDGPFAELVVVAVAETSAVTEIHKPTRDVTPGDIAYLSAEGIQAVVEQHALGATRKYPAVITFTEGGDALDEEARAFVPKRPLPSVNRMMGRIGIDYSGMKSNDASQASSNNIGGVLRVDFTRIGGTYWDLRGYWRGNIRSRSSVSQLTLQDRLNRTYHLGLTYENPNSRWVLGVGRMYLPWATSLETIDGGYFGSRLGHGTTLGLVGGSTPDPTSWNYNPNRHLAGAFFNAEGGSFDGVHYSSTSGLGKSFERVQYSTVTPTGTTTASYSDNRPFAFVENSLSYKRTFSIFHALQADRPSGNPSAASPGTGISRSFLTVRLQPFSRLEFSANHTYFRDIPTFDPQLLSTGLLDKYLFQGFSGGVRLEVVKKVFLYTDLGRSSRSGDAKTSLNQLYGITFAQLPKLGLRADAHYSRFTSSFGSGTYRSFSLSRSFADRFHVEGMGGDQVFTSSLAGNQSAKFLTGNIDTTFGAYLFLQGGFTAYRGQSQNYNQWNVTLGYRFDNKWKKK
jgi:hypothetical protein